MKKGEDQQGVNRKSKKHGGGRKDQGEKRGKPKKRRKGCIGTPIK